MIRTVALVTILAAAVPASAQQVVGGNSSYQGGPVQKLLADGYEVKTGFSDNSGGAYLVLQKTTSAYMCHSSPNQTCEKLN